MYAFFFSYCFQWCIWVADSCGSLEHSMCSSLVLFSGLDLGMFLGILQFSIWNWVGRKILSFLFTVASCIRSYICTCALKFWLELSNGKDYEHWELDRILFLMFPISKCTWGTLDNMISCVAVLCYVHVLSHWEKFFWCIRIEKWVSHKLPMTCLHIFFFFNSSFQE